MSESPDSRKNAVRTRIRLGWAIARGDAAAIERVARDATALLYGLALLFLTGFVLQLARLAKLAWLGFSISSFDLSVGLLAGGAFEALLRLAHVAVSHLICSSLLRGKGTFVEILRPMLLASPLNLLAAFTFVGSAVASLWWGVAVGLRVFEKVHRTGRVATLATLIFVGAALVLGESLWVISNLRVP